VVDKLEKTRSLEVDSKDVIRVGSGGGFRRPNLYADVLLYSSTMHHQTD